ncbi:MAG: hypothetical protein PHE75_07135 [Candidatus Cloacimonas acidaminovorans]|nr:hypothetical protein [Candidatus Cloacimonas acidaminovorans]
MNQNQNQRVTSYRYNVAFKIQVFVCGGTVSSSYTVFFCVLSVFGDFGVK